MGIQPTKEHQNWRIKYALLWRFLLISIPIERYVGIVLVEWQEYFAFCKMNVAVPSLHNSCMASEAEILCGALAKH